MFSLRRTSSSAFATLALCLILPAAHGALASRAAPAPKLAEEILVLSDNSGNPKYVVEVEKHQNKHQETKIAGLAAYEGGKGSTFPANVDLAYHQAKIAPMVLAWAKTNHQKIIDAKGKPVIPGKYEIAPDHIDFDVTATYDASSKTVHVSYHCNPNKNANEKKDFK